MLVSVSESVSVCCVCRSVQVCEYVCDSGGGLRVCLGAGVCQLVR